MLDRAPWRWEPWRRLQWYMAANSDSGSGGDGDGRGAQGGERRHCSEQGCGAGSSASAEAVARMPQPWRQQWALEPRAFGAGRRAAAEAAAAAVAAWQRLARRLLPSQEAPNAAFPACQHTQGCISVSACVRACAVPMGCAQCKCRVLAARGAACELDSQLVGREAGQRRGMSGGAMGGQRPGGRVLTR